jgi:large conductance mechanosensitive channel
VQGGKDMLKEFRAFLLRGNVLDLAVGIVIGAAFVAVVSAFVDYILTPIVGMLFSSDFSSLTFTINDSTFSYGLFLNALISFVLVGAAVFFFVVKPINMLMARRTAGGEADSDVKACPECLSTIPAPAKRCAFCTAPQ